MVKILDRYLIKLFLQTAIFGLVAFIFFFAIIDLMENLDDFIDQNVSNDVIFEYYLVFFPEIIRLMLPVSLLLSSLFTAGRLANLSELTAIKASGVSLYRFMIPFLITSFAVTIIAIYFGGYIVPIANERKVYIEQTYMKKNIVNAGSNIFFQDTATRIVTLFYFDVSRQEARRVSIQEFDADDYTQLNSRVDAERMKYDTTNSNWILVEGRKRRFTETEEIVEMFSADTVDYLNFKPRDILKKQQKPEEMTLSELSDYADEQRRTGNDPTRVLIEYHSKIAFSFACIVVVLFGLPVSSSKRKGGLAIQFGISLAITFIYLAFMKIFQAFGKNGVLDPIITSWLANIIFLAAAGIMLLFARK